METDHVPTDYVAQSAILDGTFFTVTHVDADGIKVKATCNTCVTKTVIAGSVNAISNFVTHLKVSLKPVTLSVVKSLM